MRNTDTWTPTKYVRRRGRLLATRDTRHLAVASRLAARLVAAEYDDVLPRFAHGRLVDLGCGTVPLFAAYRDLVDSTVCLDWLSTIHDTRHVDLWCDLQEALPLVDGAADTVLSSDVLEHLPDPRLAVREMARVLRPGGVLILNTPFMYRVHEAPHDYHRHTRYSLERLAVEAGFEVVELRELGGAIDVLADILAKLLATVPGMGTLLARWVQGMAVGFASTSAGRKARAASSASFPLGHLLVARVPGR